MQYFSIGGVNMKRIMKTVFFIVAIFSICMIAEPSDFVSNYVNFVYDHGW